jgi:hypothetical protein
MLKINTSAQCPVCEKHWLDYENGKFICEECKSVVDINTTHGNYSDLYELNIPYTSVKFDNRLEKLQQLCDKYNIDFLGFDEMDEMRNGGCSGFLDIGWGDGWPDNILMVIKELKKVLR